MADRCGSYPGPGPAEVPDSTSRDDSSCKSVLMALPRATKSQQFGGNNGNQDQRPRRGVDG
jgi:hypothetical protein